MFCPVTRKRSFSTRELALEALIQHHIRNHHPNGRGPINIYECDHCGNWHFTSRPPMHEELSSDAVQNRIKNERAGDYWERKLR